MRTLRSLLRLLVGLGWCLVASVRVGAALDFEPVCGGVSTSSARFVFGLQFNGDQARVVCSTSRTFTSVIASAMVTATPANHGIVSVEVGGLEPATRYYYDIELNGSRVLEAVQSFRTFPRGPASFKFTFGNSLRLNRLNQSGMLASIQEEPLFFLNTGDLHYRDLVMTYAAPYREAIQAVYDTPVHRLTMRDTPLVYMWDDHDFGPDDSDRTAPGRELALRAYRQMVPHYPLVFAGDDAPITQAFTVGRVRFILTDLRSARSPKTDSDGPEKTMLGQRQRDWFLAELESSSKTHALVFWISTVPWIQPAKARSDQWGGFAEERRLIADWIAEHQIGNLVIIGGDAHSLSVDDGSHADFSSAGNMPRVPELIASPLDNDSTSVKGGPYSHGVYEAPKGENVYGLVEVIDEGQSITMVFSGKNNRHETIIEFTHSVPVTIDAER